MPLVHSLGLAQEKMAEINQQVNPNAVNSNLWTRPLKQMHKIGSNSCK
jgi:hypothetical protein